LSSDEVLWGLNGSEATAAVSVRLETPSSANCAFGWCSVIEQAWVIGQSDFLVTHPGVMSCCAHETMFVQLDIPGFSCRTLVYKEQCFCELEPTHVTQYEQCSRDWSGEF